MKQEIKNSTLLTIGNGIVGVLSFVYASFVGRRIGPSQYADFGVALSIYYVAAMTNTPMRNLLTHFTKQYWVQSRQSHIRILLSKVISLLFKWILIIGIPLAVISPWLSRGLNLDSGSSILIVIILMESMALILNCHRGVISGLERYHAYNANFIFEASIRLIIGIVFISIFPKAITGLIAYPIAMTISVLHARFQIRDLPLSASSLINKTEIKNYLKPLLLSSLFFSILYSLDSILAKIYLDSAEAGIYMAASQITKFLYIIALSFNTIVINFTSHSASLNISAKKKLFLTLLYYYSICFLAVLVIFISANPLITFSFGKSFIGSVKLLIPLSGAVVLSGASLMMCYYVLGYGSFNVFVIPATAIFIQILMIRMMHGSALKISFATLYSQAIMASFMSIYVIVFSINFKKKSI